MFSISGVLQIFSRRFCYEIQNYWQVSKFCLSKRIRARDICKKVWRRSE